ncbi:SDR family NAD(P)-dependent oxidoreductase [Dactylosporangium sp. CA-139066]|uniref:type I polyketide synthase n=1 Tax=Dactylosporangium sp. CA-139066 TaxID=3239930 RepID=UPI003D90994E
MMESLPRIAVVGLAGRFPGASDLDEFWRNLMSGTESITRWTADELRAHGVDEADLRNTDYVPAAPVLPDADRFDAGLFGMTAREAELCDPQIRVFLEICHAAFEHAGYDPFAVPGSVGVFGAAGPNSYQDHELRRRPDLVGPAGMLAHTLNQTDYLSTTAAYRLNLRGPAMTVLTACSSTLVAIHMAAQALRAGECETAIAGGAAIRVPLTGGYLWTPGNVLSAEGHCRPFDARADGTLWGSGAAAIVLKLFDDAVADGDRVHAVLLGSAVNNDGADKVSFSAPSVSGQAAVVMEAMQLAGVAPHEVEYVEAHATGTALGDPIEVAALAQAYRALAGDVPPGDCVLGSVKSNIGHLGAVAGIAGFIKAVLALEREAIPGTAHYRQANPMLKLEETPFRVTGLPTPWPRREDRRRIAGVTSLGIGGTNAHALLAEGPPARHRAADHRPRVVVWSAREPEGERRLRGELATFLAGQGEERFADAVATLQHGRTAHRVRAAVVCDSAAAAAADLSDPAGAVVATGTVRDEPSIALLFPGQGVRSPRAAGGLYGFEREYTIAFDECLEAFEQVGVPLYRRWRDGTAVDDPAAAQPLLFSVGFSLAATWRAWTGAPAAVVGHSLGEITAATVAGVFALPDAARLVAARGASMAAHPMTGGMLAVAAAADELAGDLGDGVALAAVNDDRQTVLSGPEAALDTLTARLTRRGLACRRLPVSAAFHHPGWGAAATQWAEAFDGVAFGAPVVPFYSASTGGLAGAEALTDHQFWTGQLTRPVRFNAALTDLLVQAEPDVLLEVGPDGVLTSLARRHPLRRSAIAVRSLAGEGDDRRAVLQALAQLWVAGCAVDWSAAGQPAPMTRVALPGYPYDRSRYWVQPATEDDRRHSTTPGPAAPDRTVGGEPAPESVGAGTDDGAALPFGVVRWVEPDAGPAAPGMPAGGRLALVLLPVGADDAMAVVLAVQRAGLRPVRVEHGEAFLQHDGGFQVRPGRHEDLERVLDRLAEAGEVPDVVVHAATYGQPAAGPLDEHLSGGVLSLLALCRLVVASGHWRVSPRTVVITSRSLDVSGAEPVDPARACLLGLIRAVRREAPGLRCVGVDVGDRVDATALAGEIVRDHDEPVVALRGRHRWAPRHQAYAPPEPAARAIREDGTYVITGGCGALGLAVAKGLAGTGLRPRIALLARRDPARVAGADLAALRALGAETMVLACDVTDRAALARAVDAVNDAYGPVHGLFHLAGLAGDRMAAFREVADAAAVLAPKTVGTANLEAVFAGRAALDFAVYFSSRAATDGLVGGADYAAANAYLDAAAVSSPLARGRVLSIAWPVWGGPGMAGRAGVDVNALNRAVRDLAAVPEPADRKVVLEREMGPATDWVLDEHRVGRIPLLPGTAFLDLIVRMYRERVADSGGPVELSDVVFLAPYFDQATRLVRITMNPAGPRHDVVVESRPRDGDEPWTVHVQGRVAAAPGPADAVDLQALRLRFNTAGEPGRPSLERGFFTLGPHWDNIVDARTWGAEKLLQVAIPAAYTAEVADHALHPALLDTVTAAVRGPGQASSVPFHYRSVVVHADLPARFHAHVRRSPDAGAGEASGDLDVIGEDGTIVVAVKGFTMVMADEERVRRSARVRPPDRRDGTARSAPQGDSPVGDTVGALAPRLAVELLFRLLDAGATGPVLVAHAGALDEFPRRPVPFTTPSPSSAVPGAMVVPPVARPAPDPMAPPVGDGHDGPVVDRPVAPEGIRAAVPAPDDASLEARLRAVWLQVLGLDEVDPDQDFFDAGGNSLTAVELAARLRESLGFELRIGLLLEARTFTDLLRELEARRGEGR